MYYSNNIAILIHFESYQFEVALSFADIFLCRKMLDERQSNILIKI